MRRTWTSAAQKLVLVIILCAPSTSGFADSWKSASSLVPTSPAACPKTSAVFEFHRDGSRLTITPPTAPALTATVAADGSIDVEYLSGNVGPVRLWGNADTRIFHAVRSRVPDCRYLIAGTPNVASYAWVASVELIGGYESLCGRQPYDNYRITVDGTMFSGIPEQGETQNKLKIVLDLSGLGPDGSGRITVLSKTGVQWYFDFDAGVGPRRIRSGNGGNQCRYMFVPVVRR